MKTSRIPLIIAVLFVSLTSFSQEEIIKLNVEEGRTYVFELNSVITEFDVTGNPTTTSKSKTEIHFDIEKFNGETLIFTSKTTSSVSEMPDSKVKSITNLKFPSVVNDVNNSFNPISTIVQLLSLVELQYKVDLENNKVEFLNKQDALDEVRSIMEAKGFNDEFIAKGTDFMEKENAIWQRIHEAHQFILYFNQSVKTDDKFLKSKFPDKSFQFKENEEYIQGEKKDQPGTTFSKAVISKKHGFPLYFYEAKHDSIRERYAREKYSRLTEKEITFAEEFQTGKDLFTFECTVENPRSSFITLFFLDKPYGIEYSSKVLKLDENNRVSFQTKLQAPSFIFFSKELFRHPIEFSIPFFYAEPRDTLILNFTDDFNEPPLKISGTNATVNQFLHDVPNVRDVFFSLNPHRAIDYDVFIRAQNVTEKFNLYLKSSNVNLEGDVIEFIKNELIAIEYFHYFAFLNWYYADIIGSKKKSINQIEKEREMAKIAEQKIRDFDLHDYYNDYGIFSRKLSIQYFHYYLNNLSRIKNSEFYLVRRNIQEEFEVGKMILGGSVFYRVLADRITNSMTKGIHSLMQPATYEPDNAINLINQLINQSYSEYFKQHLQTFRDTRLNWENENYIPEATFYKPDGNTIKLEEIVKDKPTVLYINNNWGAYRYHFDREAKSYPDIQFVMIMEGEHLDEWQDYIKSAEPVAGQLLLLNHKNSLNNIFIRSNKLYIVYDKNGKLIGYDIEEKKAIKLAKESLLQKKEFDKSQLQTIVIILLILLILLTAGFIIWKWRVRQRLRKEQQQRRLRELELTAIRSQMNPHFLFNCLNSVQNLVQQNKGREAHLYLADFAGLIRKVLQNSEKEEVSLAEELETVEQYLNLEKLRFDFDFQITTDEGIDPHNTPVPSMLLQPFAENAVIHGLQNKEGEKKLKIEVSREQTRLAVSNRLAHKAEDTHLVADNRLAHTSSILIIIEDNGIGRAAAQNLGTAKNGKGSKLMQERLQILQEKQGEKYRLQITDLTENCATGTRVEIWVPEEK